MFPTETIAYTPDDRILIAVHFDPAAGARPANSLILFNKEQRVEQLLETGSDVEYVSVAVSEDGQLAAAGRATGEVDIYDLKTGQRTQQFTDHTEHVRGLGFHGPNRVFSAGSDGKFMGRDALTGEAIVNMSFDKPLLGLTIHPDGQRMLLLGPAAFRIFAVRDGKPATLQVPGHQGPVRGGAFLADPNSCATGSWDHTVRFWRFP